MSRESGASELVAQGHLRSPVAPSIVQPAGTRFFNVTTYQAMHVALTRPEYDRLVWRPDWRGSICFLVSGAIAYHRDVNGMHEAMHTVESLRCASSPRIGRLSRRNGRKASSKRGDDHAYRID